MKKFGVTVGLMLGLSAVSAFGAVVQVCAGGANTTLTYDAATINTNSYECGDKIFSNFTTTGAPAGSIFFRQINATSYELQFTGAGAGITSAFSFGFTVAVDLVTNPNNVISQIQLGMLTTQQGNTGSQIPNASTGTLSISSGAWTTQTGNNNVVNAVSAGNQNALTGTLNATTETLGFSYNPTGGAGTAGQFLSVDYVISQTTVPEPMTLSLMGVGLLGLGLLGRKRMVKR